MKTSSTNRLLAIVLAVVTLAAVLLAAANLSQEMGFDPPTDGLSLTEAPGGLLVYAAPIGSPAEHAGVRAGDLLVAINEHPTPSLASAQRLIAGSGAWSRATYTLRRRALDGHTASFDAQVILAPLSSANVRSDFQVMRLIALVYLAIGLYVLFRRWTAPRSVHFYVFCLVSFALYALKYTSRLDTLDLIVFWTNVTASALQPALFLHFAVAFTNTDVPQRRRALYPLLYIPGTVLLALRYLSLQHWAPTGVLQHRLDQIDYAYLALFYIVAAGVFWLRYRAEQQPLERQQLKWLTRGTLLTILPFTVFYVVPFLYDGITPSAMTRLAGFSLILLPLTFSWAIVRYRLMDVDLIFKRGVTYTIATAALVGLYFGVIALLAEFVHKRFAGLGAWGLVMAVIITGLLFDPLKRAIQARVDRVFDRRRIDYRETLVDFGRSLNAQTNIEQLVSSIVERLPQTLLVTRVAVFLADAQYEGHFTLVASHGLAHRVAEGERFDLDFLRFGDGGRASDNHIFFDNPQSVLRLPTAQRETAAALDLNYYLPCRAASHEGAGLQTIAVIGLGRTHDGDFLSSEDVELLESLASYIAIAIQNALLYRTLQQKITDFERLKDFNENIVESINVGVFAVDLNDCIESWNAQMEVLQATPRAEALRKSIRDVFSPEFADQFDRVRAEQGVSSIFKFRYSTPAGETRTANITIAPLLNRDFEAVGRIVIVDDQTERLQLEAQLTQSEKLSSIGLLAAGVAHEVNTPLAVISSYTQMLSKQLRLSPEADRLTPVLEKITQQTFRASEIVNGLLNFSRTGSTAFTSVNLNALLRETATLLEHALRSGRVDVRFELAESLPAVHGNPGKLQQVFVNLIMNAKDAMQDRGAGTITIHSAAENGMAVLRIADDGAGMSAETLRRIYDPFFTTKGNPKAGQRRGTGLGLAVTYGIMQEHFGKIAVQSVEGEGTEFRLEFPEQTPASQRTPVALEGNAVHV